MVVEVLKIQEVSELESFKSSALEDPKDQMGRKNRKKSTLQKKLRKLQNSLKRFRTKWHRDLNR